MIEPSILKYARISSGYDIESAAKKAHVRDVLLNHLEKEKIEISVAQLQRLANVYKRPLAYFLLERIPKDVVLPKDFRIVYQSADYDLSPAVMLAVRRARYIQSIVQELSDSRFEFDFPQASIAEDIERIASSFRAQVGVSIE